MTDALQPSGDVGPASDRDARGRFRPGNGAAVVSGARSLAFWEAVSDERRRLRAELLASRGFSSEADAPAGLVLAADGAAQACLLRDASFERLVEQGGPTTDKGRTRRVLLVWQGAADRALRHLLAVGLGRTERNAGTLAEWLDAESGSSR
jgi:hypothetical protein